MKRLVLGVVLLLVLAFVAQQQQAKVAQTVVCGEVKGGTVMLAKGVDWAEDFGTWLHDLASKPVGPDVVKATVEGVEKVLWYWIRTWFLSSKGLALDPEILQVQQEQEQARQAAEAQCTPCPQALPQDSSPLASLGAAPVTGSPEEIVRQVAARYWPADQVATAVAVAGAESSWNPRASLNYRGEHMRGLWQINDGAHADLIAGKDWADPSVNAYTAHQIWENAGKSWTPWSTYNSGSYKRFLKPSAVTASLSNSVPGSVTPKDGTFTPDATAGAEAAPAPANPQNVGCSSEGMPAARIATWNSFHGSVYPHESQGNDGRVVDGMLAIAKQADIINTQELSSGSRRAKITDAMDKAGFAVAGGDTSTPIYVRRTFAITSQQAQSVYRRGDNIDGPDQGNRWVVTAVLRSATGQMLTDINYHQLPHIQSHGTWNRGEPKRKAMAQEIIATAMTSARTHMTQGAVTVACDCNWDGDPDGAYRAAGLTMASQVFGTVNTLRHREIDQILFSAGSPTAERELGRYGSDHVARVVDFPPSTGADPSASPVDGVTPADFNFPGQNTVDQAIAYMSNGHRVRRGTCLHEVGAAYGHQGTYTRDGSHYAIEQWEMMPAKYKHTDGSVPPRGALLFFTTGNPAGHIAISAGGGYAWTTDPNGHPGTIGKVPMSMLEGWGAFKGWSPPFFPGMTKTGASAA